MPEHVVRGTQTRFCPDTVCSTPLERHLKRISRRHVTQALNLLLRELRQLFPTEHVLAEARQHLVDTELLVDKKWNGLNRERSRKEQTNETEYETFEPISRIFDPTLA